MFENLTTPKTCSPRCVVRSNGSGVWHAEVVELDGDTVKLRNARRVWKWDGAATLSELATKGVSRPAGCKMPAAVDEVVVFNVLELIPCTERASKSIDNVPIWTEHES